MGDRNVRPEVGVFDPHAMQDHADAPRQSHHGTLAAALVAKAAVLETTTAASFHTASALRQTTRPACCFILRTEFAKAAMNTAVRIRITVGAGALSR